MSQNQKHVCRICGNSQNNKTFVAKEMMLGLREEFLYYECSNCNCLQIAEFPEDMGRYYPSGYYSFRKIDRGSSKNIVAVLQNLRVKSGILPGHNFPISIINTLLPFKNTVFLKGTVKNSDVRILDVGCGNGEKFLEPLYQAGFQNVAGCDPYLEKEIAGSDGPVLYKKEMAEMKGEWDVITFNHSFEHLANPLETLQQANDLLKQGGYCIIRIPTASSYAWQHYRVNWFQLDAPRHFFLHSVQSIRFLAEKAKFELQNIIFDSTHHQFTISERYKKGKTMKERSYNTTLGRLANLVQKFKYAILARKLNRQKRGDQAIFYLKK